MCLKLCQKQSVKEDNHGNGTKERLTRVGEGLAMGNEGTNYSRNSRKEPLKEERNNGFGPDLFEN